MILFKRHPCQIVLKPPERRRITPSQRNVYNYYCRADRNRYIEKMIGLPNATEK